MSNAVVHEPFGVSSRARSRASAPRRHVLPLSLVVLSALLGACGGRHLRLVSPDTTAGPRYACAPGEGAVCQPASVDVPSESNPSGTVFVILPRECRGKVHQIIVIDADSSNPKVEATCAPQEEPVEEMSRSEPGSTPPAESSRVATGEDDAPDVSIH